MKFDGMSVEQLEARQAEIAGMETEGATAEDIESDYPKRTVEHISRVLEVSAVAFPAYPQTDLQVASEDATLDSARASLESARKAAEEERQRIAEDERRTAALDRLNKLIMEVKQHEV